LRDRVNPIVVSARIGAEKSYSWSVAGVIVAVTTIK